MERTFVVIFFFWAVLTIITPTLILMSEKSKANLDSNGQNDEGMEVRRMVQYIEKYSRKIPIALAPKEAPTPAPAPAPAPEPEPALALKPALSARKATLTIFSKQE